MIELINECHMFLYLLILILTLLLSYDLVLFSGVLLLNSDVFSSGFYSLGILQLQDLKIRKNNTKFIQITLDTLPSNSRGSSSSLGSHFRK